MATPPPLPPAGSKDWYESYKWMYDRHMALLGAVTGTPAKPEPVSPLPVLVAPTRTINATTSALLTSALADLRWGDKIVLSAGVNYGKRIFTSPSIASYSSASPPPGIWITGPRTAIIDGGSTASGYALHLDGADYMQLEGFTVQGGQKGIMCDEMNYARLVSLEVKNVGHELVHLRNNSSDNLVQNCVISGSGLTETDYGEGLYIGQSVNNWDASMSRTGGAPDRSDRNSLIGNTLSNIKAEPIDVKEGTTGGVILNNTMNGSAIAGTNSADSFIDIKGNRYRIEGNTATAPSASVVHAFTTHILYAGFGNDNVFKNNSVVAGGKTSGAENTPTNSSQGYNIQTSGSRGSATGNIVYSDNSATGAPGGLSNIPVTPV